MGHLAYGDTEERVKMVMKKNLMKDLIPRITLHVAALSVSCVETF